jgi:hypothetical protein
MPPIFNDIEEVVSVMTILPHVAVLGDVSSRIVVGQMAIAAS